MYVKTNRKLKRKILVCEDDLGLSCWKGGGASCNCEDKVFTKGVDSPLPPPMLQNCRVKGRIIRYGSR